MHRFTATFSITPARALLAVVLIGLHLGVVAHALTGNWRETFLRLDVPAMDVAFGDLRVFPAAIASREQGFDPLAKNPADLRGRTLNYPRVWLLIGRLFVGETGIIAGGIAFVLFFSATVAWLIASQRTNSAAVGIFLVAISGSSWLAIERGNADILMFSLVALGLVIPWRYRAVLIGLAAMLKIFPVAAVVAKAARDRSRISLIVAGVVIVYLLAMLGDIALITKGTEVGGFLSFGIKSVVMLFGTANPPIGAPTIYAAYAVGSLMALGAALALPLRGQPAPVEEECAFVGGAVLLLAFVAASNWDYRLTFSILTIPFFLRPAVGWEKVFGWIAATTTVVACNFPVLAAHFGDNGIIVNSAAKYLLYCFTLFAVARIGLQDALMQSLLLRVRSAPRPA
jgi:hypothetical protein